MVVAQTQGHGKKVGTLSMAMIWRFQVDKACWWSGCRCKGKRRTKDDS